MYYAMRASAPSLHRESTDSLIHVEGCLCVCPCACLLLYSSSFYGDLHMCSYISLSVKDCNDLICS